MRIVVTGSSGCLARALLPRLLDDARVERVIGVDWREADLAHPRFEFHRLDIRDPRIAPLFAGAGALVHLAFVVMPAQLGRRRRERALIRDIDVRGGMHVFEAAARAGVRTLVHLSSAAVYALPAPRPADEGAPFGALPGFAYAEDKIALERALDALERAAPHARLVRLRPHVILGPRAQPFLKTLATIPCYPILPPHARTQVVHEDDVAQAVVRALFGEARGAFNLACADSLTFAELARVCGRALALPLPLVRGGLRLAWALGYGIDPAWCGGLAHGLVLDTRRARAELGWAPRYDDAAGCLRAL